ncbi:MAG: tRNA (guanosine(37)-N1)-methyltransferase TrmD [Patescibacteria group bacterium]
MKGKQKIRTKDSSGHRRRSRKTIKFKIITLFSKAIGSYFKESVLGRAEKQGLIETKFIDLRDFSPDEKHKKVDDRAFGGGPGMVLKFEPIKRAVDFVLDGAEKRKKKRVILFSTRGKIFDSKEAKRLSKYEELIFICGRYEGVDERVAEFIADEEISIGNYVLTGGELVAAVVADATARFILGVLGKEESLEENKGSYPVYTRPEEILVKNKKTGKIKKLKVPEILLSGDHKKIDEWRKRGKS